jgi:two-component system response regulator HydG
MPVSALLISADPTLVKGVAEVVNSIAGLDLCVAPCAADAGPLLRRGGIALLLVHLPEGGDVAQVGSLLRQVVASSAATPLVVICESYRPDQTLALLRQGAADCLGRPLDLHRLAYMADMLTLRPRYLARQVEPVADGFAAEELSDHERFLYPRHGPMGRLMEQVRTVAPQDTTVLLGGETGTGKTCLARLMHGLSPRRNEPFVVVNCGSLAHNLIESELFGHVKGAFTGADRDRTGKFAAVGKGTLVLDEIDALPLPLQAKLLRGVEERLFEAVGSNQTQRFDARLIVASNRDLKSEVEAGRFRSDLYYRFNVVAFFMPPLRERPAIIPALTETFIEKFATAGNRPVREVSADAQSLLLNYRWPGNIRELRNAIERAVALCAGTVIQPGDLPDEMRAGGVQHEKLVAAVAAATTMAGTLGEAKEVAEASRIREALKRNKNNRLRAAAELGISRMTLYKKLHRYGLMLGS